MRGMFRTICVLGLAIASIASSPVARAFSLSDHQKITEFAVTQFNFCFDGLLNAGLEETLQSAVRDEDTNLPKKWALYSHFYNPNKKLEDLSRLDSSQRVVLLQKEIRDKLGTSSLDDWSVAFDDAAHAIHHIQDMESPPHVVPVMHSLFDGFENYEIPAMEYPDFQLNDAYCQRLRNLAKPMGLYQILRESALATLASLNQKIAIRRYVLNDPVQNDEITWREGYWRESSENRFGDYGSMGNTFGQSTVVWGDLLRIEVPAQSFKEFKKARLRDAIDRTVEALTWFFFAQGH